jgi:hypothetical protein
MFWSIGVMSNLYQESSIKIPCSAYSLSMHLAVSVDFWDTDEGSMGEDMHMYLKCFFATRGQLIVKSIFSPASQCNVESGSYRYNIANYVSGLSARYVQAVRHIWGTLDFSYALEKTVHYYLGVSADTNMKLKNIGVNKLGKGAAKGVCPLSLDSSYRASFHDGLTLVSTVV